MYLFCSSEFSSNLAKSTMTFLAETYSSLNVCRLNNRIRNLNADKICKIYAGTNQNNSNIPQQIITKTKSIQFTIDLKNVNLNA